MSLDDHEDPEEQLQQDSSGDEVSSLENLQIDLLTIHDGSIQDSVLQTILRKLNNVEQQNREILLLLKKQQSSHLFTIEGSEYKV